MPSTSIDKHFASELGKVKIFAGGKTSIDVKPLEPEERQAIISVWEKGMANIRMVSPKIAATLEPQLGAYLKWGEVAKATIPNDKPIRYPAEVGTIGVDWISPANYMYYAGASAAAAGQRDYSGYDDKVANLRGHDWDMTMVINTTQYIAGGSGTYYKGGDADDMHSLPIIAQDGIIEIGTTPSVTEMRFITEAQTKYSPINMSPLVSLPIEREREIYQYQTLGQVPLWHNFGTQITVFPVKAGVSVIPLLGLVFFEYDLFSTLV